MLIGFCQNRVMFLKSIGAVFSANCRSYIFCLLISGIFDNNMPFSNGDSIESCNANIIVCYCLAVFLHFLLGVGMRGDRWQKRVRTTEPQRSRLVDFMISEQKK